MQMDAPEVETMVRDLGPFPERAAINYARHLPPSQRAAVNGCYVVWCCCSCCDSCHIPVATVYNLSCSNCLWAGLGTIPLGCFVFLNSHQDNGYQYFNGSRTESSFTVMKVDTERDAMVVDTKLQEGE